MPRQHKCRSINAATGTTNGDSYESRGHNSVGLFVVARNLDETNDSLEVVLDAVHTDENTSGEEQGPVRRSDGGPGSTSRVGVTAGDLGDPGGDGTYSGFAYAHGVPAEHFAARITEFTDNAGSDLEVDAWLYFGNWSGPGREFREVV
ncbi:hypothetical protein DNAM5_115 [Haloarcula californiae tailed virus 1]|uniref:Uncharacterized protein n=1 Tax=Haloarcula californiae tailed virus 1 TaxID=1273746 RepID=R4T881_9CAUD|nr:hypothetical protein M202_gp104 [Haloarcula californiae tailed virus 1]AGM11974.1 hypothetical protein DNAM5_115 [Haloarcula californiae tailed virus 1]